MTDRRGRRARWTVAAVLAPGTAAVFSAAMAWAAHATPTAASTTPPVTARPQVHTIPDRAAAITAAKALAQNQAQVAHLDHLLATLRHEMARVRAAERAAATRAPVTSQGAGSGGYVTTQPAPPITVQAPAPVVVPAPAPPAPPVHATTGASGAKP